MSLLTRELREAVEHAGSDAGLTVLRRSGRLVVTGPEVAEDAARVLIEHEPEVLAVLAPTPPDGCDAHQVTEEAVAERWSEVRRRDLRPGFCLVASAPHR